MATFHHNTVSFSVDKVIDKVNSELSKTTSKIRATEFISNLNDCPNALLLKAGDDKELVVLLYRPNKSSFAIKAIHKIKNTQKHAAWLFNGQASRNLHTLVFNGEEGDLFFVNKQDYSAFIDRQYPNSSQKVKEKQLHFESFNNPVIKEEISIE
jgi:hypothetical protein